jgi:PIN domain nuclease of toxin-antitoxin system
MDIFVVDTHALAWFLAEDSRLSPLAQRTLSAGEVGEAQVLISTLVLAELTYIAQRQRVPVAMEEALVRIEAGDGFVIVPFDLPTFRILLELPSHWDIHDRIIAATAKLYEAKLITRDTMLRDAGVIEVLW